MEWAKNHILGLIAMLGAIMAVYANLVSDVKANTEYAVRHEAENVVVTQNLMTKLDNIQTDLTDIKIRLSVVETKKE